jgi:chromosome segregation ATPase
METILILILAIAAVALVAYVARLKRIYKSEKKNLNEQMHEEIEAREEAEENAHALTEANAHLRADLKYKDKQINDLIVEVSELKSRNQQHTKAYDALQSKSKSLMIIKTSLEGQAAQLQQEIEKRKEDSERVISLVSAHNNELRANSDKLQSEVTHLRTELDALNARLEEAGNIHQAAMDKAAENDRVLLGVNEDLTGKLKILQTEHETRSLQNQALAEELGENKAIIETLQNQLSALEEQLNELKNERVIQDSAFRYLETDYNLKKEIIDSLEEQNKNLKENIVTREEDVTALNQQVDKLEAEMSALKVGLRELAGLPANDRSR